MGIRIVLADNHKVVLQGLQALLGEQQDMEVVGQALDGRQAVELVRKLSPDVVIMDIVMPNLNGIEATRQILAESSRTRVIALSSHPEEHLISQVLQAGATAYLPKTCDFRELLKAITTTERGGIYLNPSTTLTIVEKHVRRSRVVDSTYRPELTSREREVLQLLAEGLSSKQIAPQLHVTVRTIDAHRQNIMEKLDIHSIAELTKHAIREGLTSLEF